MMRSAIVVGAGPSGLGCATTLASGGISTELVDRIPVTGGEAGWDRTDIRSLARDAEHAGVTFRLGATGCRWEEGRLLVASAAGISWVAADWLFFAGGRRPATAVELGLTGERPAGVVPATVAKHLLSHGVALWQNVVILGSGFWALEVAAQVRALGGAVTAIGARQGSWRDDLPGGDGVMEVVGRRRVEALRVGTRVIDCDAVILAGDPRPTRNVVGALDESAHAVTFVQPLDVDSVRQRSDAGRLGAEQWLRSDGRPACA
jgi:hypothetical protein